MENFFLVAGIGCQGIRAVSGMQESVIADRIYIDQNPLEFIWCPPNGSDKILLPLCLDREAFDPAWRIRKFLENRREQILGTLESYRCLILVLGVGGKTSLAVMEFIGFLRSEVPDFPFYVLGTFPFRNETDYVTGCIANRFCGMLKGRGKTGFGWTMINNEAYLQKHSEVTYEKIYKNSAQNLTAVLDMIFTMMKEGLWESGISAEDMISLLGGGGPVYIEDYSADKVASFSVYDRETSFMPYKNALEGPVFFRIEKNRESLNIPKLLDVMQKIRDEKFGKMINVKYYISETENEQAEMYKIQFLSRGVTEKIGL